MLRLLRNQNFTSRCKAALFFGKNILLILERQVKILHNKIISEGAPPLSLIGSAVFPKDALGNDGNALKTIQRYPPLKQSIVESFS